MKSLPAMKLIIGRFSVYVTFMVVIAHITRLSVAAPVSITRGTGALESLTAKGEVDLNAGVAEILGATAAKTEQMASQKASEMEYLIDKHGPRLTNLFQRMRSRGYRYASKHGQNFKDGYYGARPKTSETLESEIPAEGKSPGKWSTHFNTVRDSIGNTWAKTRSGYTQGKSFVKGTYTTTKNIYNTSKSAYTKTMNGYARFKRFLRRLNPYYYWGKSSNAATPAASTT